MFSSREQKREYNYKNDDDELRKCRQVKIEDDRIIKRNKVHRWIGKWCNEEKENREKISLGEMKGMITPLER